MRIKTDTEREYPEITENEPKFDLLLCGFNTKKRIRYGKELSGETNVLKDIAALSERKNLTIVAAFDTDNYGIIKHSACVFDRGKLLGISDMSVSLGDSPYMPGGSAKIFDTSAGKIGVAVGDDLYSYDLMRAFALCGAEAVIAVGRRQKREPDGIITRAYAYLTGLPIIALFGKCAVSVNVKGEISPADEYGVYEVEPLTEYALKTTRVKFYV